MSNAVMEGDIMFLMSEKSRSRLVASAKFAGVTYRKYFRTKAAQLVHKAGPKFDIPGDDLSKRVLVGVPPYVLTGLHRLCTELGVPLDMAGELVACATFQPVVDA